MKQFLLTALFLIIALYHIAAQRIYEVHNSAYAPEYGVWNEGVWSGTPVTDSFTTTLPAYGRVPVNPTTVQMCISGDNLLIKATCSSDRVRDDGSLRDDTENADFFTVGFDTWNDHQNAFTFTVTASGQQTDERITGDRKEQRFNALWYSEVQRTASGWSVCFIIPFKALHFPVKGEQNWGIQFTRFDRTTGETSTWNPQNPLITDEVWQYGQLKGLGTIYTPVHTSLSLYNDLYKTVRQYSSSALKLSDDYNFLGYGIDARINLKSATTLDFTVIPGVSTFSVKSDTPEEKYESRHYRTNESRPMLMEERVAFHRAYGFAELPVFRSYWPVQNNNNFVGTTSGGLAINSFRLVTQTKRGIRLGMSNSIYQKAILTTYSPTTIAQAQPHHPIYNFIFAEKLFRNNSFMHIGLTNVRVHKGLDYQQVAAAGQLRDRKNRFQIKANYAFYTKAENLLKQQKMGEGAASIAKINGKWTGAIAYISPNRISADSFLPPSAQVQYFRSALFHTVQAHLTHRNFTCKSSFWLNTVHQLAYSGIRVEKDSQMINNDLLSYQFKGQNHRFQTWTLTTSISNQRSLKYLYIGGLNLKNEIQYPWSAALGFSTDSRKRSIWSTGMNITKYMNSEQFQNFGFGRYNYTLNKFLNVQYNLVVFNRSKELTKAVEIDNKNFLSYYNNLTFSNNIQVLLRYNSNFMVSAALGFLPKQLYYRIKDYELDADIMLIPTDMDLPRLSQSSDLNSQFAVHYFRHTSHVILSYRSNNRSSYTYLSETLRIGNATNTISLSYLWNISQDIIPKIYSGISNTF